MKYIIKNFRMFLFGAVIYGTTEVLWRGRTHFTMLIVGGIVFVILDNVYAHNHNSLLEKCVIGGVVITGLEFISGIIINIVFKMGVWDYSGLPLNFMGQICLYYSLLWVALCVPVNYICLAIDRYSDKSVIK